MDVTGWILEYAFGDRNGNNNDVMARCQYRIFVCVGQGGTLCERRRVN
jgi:hypothetical protein